MYTEWKAVMEQAVATGRRQLPVHTEWCRKETAARVYRVESRCGAGCCCG